MSEGAFQEGASTPPEVSAVEPVPTGAPRKNALVGLVLILTSAAGYGSQPIFARLAYAAGANVSTVLLLRFVLALAVLWPVLLLGRRGKYIWAVIKQPRRLLSLLVLGVLFSGNSIAFFTALTYLHTAVVELLLYLYPGVVLVLSAIFLRERLGLMKLLALLCAVAGSALTVGPLGAVALPGVTGGKVLLGLGLGLSAALIYATYIVVGNRLAAGTPADVTAAVSMTGTMLVFIVGALFGDGATLRLSVHGWLAIAGVALFSSVIATSFFLAGLERLGPSRAAILATVEPVVTLTLATLVLHDPPLWFQVVGGGLILVAVVLAQLAPRRTGVSG
ncbi:MAG TPA: DMT family transporter [Ktedonobacterales bacterium]|nr:DMT family transporter [Ktedonobacterales bacterium]